MEHNSGRSFQSPHGPIYAEEHWPLTLIGNSLGDAGALRVRCQQSTAETSSKESVPGITVQIEFEVMISVFVVAPTKVHQPEETHTHHYCCYNSQQRFHTENNSQDAQKTQSEKTICYEHVPKNAKGRLLLRDNLISCPHNILPPTLFKSIIFCTRNFEHTDSFWCSIHSLSVHTLATCIEPEKENHVVGYALWQSHSMDTPSCNAALMASI